MLINADTWPEAGMEHFIRQSYIFISDGDEALRFLLGVLMFHFASLLYYRANRLPAGAGLSRSFLLCRGLPDNSLPQASAMRLLPSA